VPRISHKSLYEAIFRAGLDIFTNHLGYPLSVVIGFFKTLLMLETQMAFYVLFSPECKVEEIRSLRLNLSLSPM
jgi:hypothetical protein